MRGRPRCRRLARTLSHFMRRGSVQRVANYNDCASAAPTQGRPPTERADLADPATNNCASAAPLQGRPPTNRADLADPATMNAAQPGPSPASHPRTLPARGTTLPLVPDDPGRAAQNTARPS